MTEPLWLSKRFIFVDGDKRTGFMTAAVFLDTNGFELAASEAAAASMTLGLAAGDITQEEYAEWLRAETKVVK